MLTINDLETIFIVLQTCWDLLLVLGFSLLISVVLAYFVTIEFSEEEIEDYLNKS